MGVAGTLSDNCAVIYIAQFLPSIALFAQLILPFLQRSLFVTEGDGPEGGFQDGVYFSRLLKRENKNHALIVTILNLTLNLIQS